MKLSKKILGAMLCGLIVVGGSNATLVKANAQTSWRMGVGFATHLIGLGVHAGTSYAKLDLVLEDGNLKLEGSPNVAWNRTFSDTFRIGWKKKNQTKFESPIVFRQCWQADAQKTLRNVVKIFNNAGIKEGDEIFIHGEKSDVSMNFYDLNKIKRQDKIIISSKPYERPYYSYKQFYENYHRHCTSFRVTNKGLEAVQNDVYNGRVCPR